MDKYKSFSVEDFLQDEFFLKWVTDPNSAGGEIWWEWLQENQQMKEVIWEAKRIVKTFEKAHSKMPADFYEKLKARIDRSLDAEMAGNRVKMRLFARWFQAAAIVAGLIIAAAIVTHLMSGSGSRVSKFSSRYAEVKRFVLPDSSEAILNAHSTLRFTDNATEREAWLEGEAFFKIKHIEGAGQNARKFIVHAKDVNVEVTGTEFNVSSQPAEETKVLLTKGKVRLSNAKVNTTQLTMQPGDYASYNGSKGFTVKRVNEESYISWINGQYIFEKTPLLEVSRQLSRYYGKEITITDAELRYQRLSGSLELQDEKSLKQTLSTLLGVRVSEKNNRIIIGSN